MEIRLTRRFPPPPGPSAQPLAANATNVDNVESSANAFACCFTAPKYTPRGPPGKRAAGSPERAKQTALLHGAARKIHEFSIPAPNPAPQQPTLAPIPPPAAYHFP